MHDRPTRHRRVIGASVLSLFCLILSADANQPVPSGNLAGHWPFDSAVSPSPDVGPSLNNATLTGAPPVGAGLFGTGLNFNGTSQYATVTGTAVSLNIGTGSFTVGAWVKPNGTGVMRVINKWDNTLANGFLLDLNAKNGGTAQAGCLRLRAKSGTIDSDYFVTVPGGFATNVWHHIAGVYNRDTAGSFFAKLYVDGKPVGAPKTTGIPTGSLNTTTNLGIAWLASGTATPYFKGVMDEPVFYTRALTDAEVETVAAVPQGVTASTAQIGQITLNWTAVFGANSYSVMRSSTTGGPYTLVNTVTTTSFIDTTATAGTYYYVIRANFTSGGGFSSANSIEARGVGLLPVMTALPNLGLFTNEAGGQTNFDIQINRAIPSGTTVTITVTSSRPGEGWVQDASHGPADHITIPVTGPKSAPYTIPITVTGQQDAIADGPQPYQVTVTTSSSDLTFDKLSIPPVQITNNDDEVAGITFSHTTVTTTESGGTDTVLVSLNTPPVGVIDLTLTSSDLAEGTVTPVVTFTNALYKNIPVVVTGVDDPFLDFTIPYTVSSVLTTHNAGDAAYNTVFPPLISASNLDNEVVPDPPHAWGGSGSGCGLTGLDAVALLALASLARRRRRR